MIFQSEPDLIEALEIHDKIIIDCVGGLLSFWDFVEKYNDFYWYYALDGHESVEGEQSLLNKYYDRILPHREISETILNKVCSKDDANKEAYQKANRIGPDLAVSMLNEIVSKHFKGKRTT